MANSQAALQEFPLPCFLSAFICGTNNALDMVPFPSHNNNYSLRISLFEASYPGDEDTTNGAIAVQYSDTIPVSEESKMRLNDVMGHYGNNSLDNDFALLPRER